MDLEKKYIDIDGNNCNILDLVKQDPEWVANIIQWYDDKLRKTNKMLLKVLKDMNIIVEKIGDSHGRK